MAVAGIGPSSLSLNSAALARVLARSSITPDTAAVQAPGDAVGNNPAPGASSTAAAFQPSALNGATAVAAQTNGAEPSASTEQPSASASSGTLSDEQKSAVEKLKQTDAKVKAHEQAHQAAGGRLAAGASYSYEKGPDGGSYAVAGEVSINTSSVPGNPRATLEQALQVQAAALAPADPSAQDRAVAVRAAQTAAAAQAEITKQAVNAADGGQASGQAGSQAGASNDGQDQAAAGGDRQTRAVTGLYRAAASLGAQGQIQRGGAVDIAA